MAPPKKEKSGFINVRIPISRLKQVKQAAKIKGILNCTEFARQAIYEMTDRILANHT